MFHLQRPKGCQALMQLILTPSFWFDREMALPLTISPWHWGKQLAPAPAATTGVPKPENPPVMKPTSKAAPRLPEAKKPPVPGPSFRSWGIFIDSIAKDLKAASQQDHLRAPSHFPFSLQLHNAPRTSPLGWEPGPVADWPRKSWTCRLRFLARTSCMTWLETRSQDCPQSALDPWRGLRRWTDRCQPAFEHPSDQLPGSGVSCPAFLCNGGQSVWAFLCNVGVFIWQVSKSSSTMPIMPALWRDFG